MKKIIFWGSILVLAALLVTSYIYWLPQLGEQYYVKASNIYFEVKTSKEPAQLQKALDLTDWSIRLGYNNSTVQLFKGQLLTDLCRADDARQLYLKVKAKDPTATQAVDDLLKKLPQ